jgi:hypothetical protein
MRGRGAGRTYAIFGIFALRVAFEGFVVIGLRTLGAFGGHGATQKNLRDSNEQDDERNFRSLKFGPSGFDADANTCQPQASSSRICLEYHLAATVLARK